MTFDRLWVLSFLPVLLICAAFQWRVTSRRAGLVLKVLGFAALIVALAEPRLAVWETKVAVAVLADTSASVSDDDLARASRIASEIDKARGRHWVRVMPFARDTRAPAANEHSSPWKFSYTSGAEGHGTNLESAIRDAVAALPSGLVPRVVLISDGIENRGSIARAAWQAREVGIPIDTYALAGKREPGLRLESVSFPAIAFTGEKFPIDVVVRSSREANGQVEIRAETKPLGTVPVNLTVGVNHFRVHASLNESGAFDVSGVIRAAGIGEVNFAQALTFRRPRVLFLSQDPPAADAHLLGVLKAAEFETRDVQDFPPDLKDYQLVVLNNWDLKLMPAARKQDLQDFVKRGGGLLVIGGERNIYYLDEAKKEEDPLEKALPAKLAPPRSPEGTCVVLIVDKSSSMEGKKMQLARMAAIGVIDNLRPVDRVGVLIFDNSFQWAVPIRLAEDRNLIKRLVSGITPDGGTQIAPALAEAYRRIRPMKSTFKHIVLLTDGISEEGDSISLAQEASGQRVTISTVGLGQDVNKGYLEKVAALAKGRSYMLSDPTELERILIRDVLEHTGSTAVEKPIAPVVLKRTETLEGVGIESAPPLKGYVRFESKPTAETILSIERKDPLFVRWQYGLGRSAVFASDAKNRWASDWLAWTNFGKFWTNVLHDLLPRAHSGEAVATFNSANGELIADYRLAAHTAEPSKVPDIFVLGPDGFRRPLPIRKLATGTYQGRIHIGEREGLFRIRSLDDNAAFPEIGFYRTEQELKEYGSSETLLRQVSEFTGGRWQPAPADVFDSNGRAVATTMRLWPGLIGLAILLNLAELAHRKWRGLLELLGRSR